MTSIESVGVLGPGLVGSGIAQAAAAAGYRSVVHDTVPDQLVGGRKRIATSLAGPVEKGKLAPDTDRAALDRPTLSVGPAGCDLIIEAATKEVVIVRDQSGFIGSLLLVPYRCDAIRATGRGVATLADLDTAMRLGAGSPMGPPTLTDFVGPDTLSRIGEIMFDEYRETRHAAPPRLKRMATGGRLGHESGRGFHDDSVELPAPGEFR